RELEEETGYTTEIQSLKFVDSFYTSPGFADEKMYIYLATEIEKLEIEVEGDEDEFVELLELTLDEAFTYMREERIHDAKTNYALMYLKAQGLMLMMIQPYFADLHIHIGRDKYKKPVEITGSKNLTLTNILKEASRRKGIDLIGVIDSHAPAVQQEIIDLIQKGDATEIEEGGIRFENVTLILGAEIEVYDEHCKGPLHTLCFFPTLEKMRQFTEWLVGKMKNITLSSQRYYGTGKALQYETKRLDGLFIPAHVFTPFKSLY